MNVYNLAIRFVLFDRPKALAALFGIVVAVFLVGQQLGILLFLTGLMTALPDRARADIWVTDAGTTNANSLRRMDIRVQGYVASAARGSRVRALVLAGATATLPDGGSAGVTLVGSDGPDFPAGPWGVVRGSAGDLAGIDAVSVDVFDRATLGGARAGSAFEVAGRRVVAVAESRGARGFGGVFLFTTAERARALGRVPETSVSALLVEVPPATDPAAVRDDIRRAVPGVRAWLPEELSAATRSTILATSGIAMSVGTLIVFAIVAGFATVALTMYSAAVERLRDYGTMKAIGATDRTVASLVLAQALLFGAVGHALGAGLTEAFRRGVDGAGVTFSLPLAVQAALAGLTLTLCVGGASLAVRRVARLEPASVLRG